MNDFSKVANLSISSFRPHWIWRWSHSQFSFLSIIVLSFHLFLSYSVLSPQISQRFSFEIRSLQSAFHLIWIFVLILHSTSAFDLIHVKSWKRFWQPFEEGAISFRKGERGWGKERSESRRNVKTGNDLRVIWLPFDRICINCRGFSKNVSFHIFLPSFHISFFLSTFSHLSLSSIPVDIKDLHALC